MSLNVTDDCRELVINTLSSDVSSLGLLNYHLENFAAVIPTVESLVDSLGVEKAILLTNEENQKKLRDNISKKLTLEVVEKPNSFNALASKTKKSLIIDLTTIYNKAFDKVPFYINGAINKPGLYETDKKTPILELIYDYGGGLSKPHNEFKAIVWGGALGLILNKKLINNEISRKDLDLSDNVYLSNTFMVINNTSCIVNLTSIFTLYNYQKLSSCSGCNFCKTHLKQCCETLERIVKGQGNKDDTEILKSLSKEKYNDAKCYQGRQSLLPLSSALNNFSQEFQEHIEEKYCQASVCEDLFLSSCSNACPANVDLPGTIGLMQKGLYHEAVALGRETNPFFLSCGRICEEPPCQKYCQRQTIDQPINSRALHRYAGDKLLAENIKISDVLKNANLVPSSSTNKNIAVVGAGPAGLTAAYFLARYGHKVTVYEKLKVAGGMMRVGIPDYRLPVNILEGEINHILSLGVEVVYGKELGKDITLQELSHKYAAVYLAIGAHASKTMGLRGEDLPGVMSGIEFLAKLNQDQEVNLGKKVIVVGGGNVAIDAARCALRQGAEDIKIVYRRSLDDMPAALEEIEAAQAEKIEILPMTNPVEVMGNEKIEKVVLQKMKPGKYDASGRKKPTKTEEFIELEVDNLIIAVGQNMNTDDLTGSGIETKWDNIIVDPKTFVTSVEGVFAGGDCVSGPATAVEAIGHGGRAAEAIHQYLGLEKIELPSNRMLLSNYVGPYSCEKSLLNLPKQVEVEKRVKSFIEVEKPYNKDEADAEMKRCICSAKTGL
ncbi:NADH-quinone oxidoreductase subunit F [Desulfitispora alkaliphila]|uniref:FAD-dependent oxidoreductase n=1 Tax=Desulfitispora alkaliphila TaxID=622674 RepID=UPI003D234A5E